MPTLRGTIITCALLLPHAVTAQQPDSGRILPEIGVSVLRTASSPSTLGLSLTTLDAEDARRGRPSPTLDDLLAFVPGVLARDRPDRSLDTRIAIRGAGSRANFGVRGVRVLVDGVPATLPDGQTPLTTLDLELAERIEVARGPMASLHGTGSLGVLAIQTPARFAEGVHARAAVSTARSPTAAQGFAAIGGGGRTLGGLVALSAIDETGVRQHSAAEQWRARVSVEWRPTNATVITLRGNWASDPRLEAPGALTLAEFRTDPTMAAPASVARNAGKKLSQRQVSVGLRHQVGWATLVANGWILGRDLDNPLAAPAPAPAAPSEGVWVDLDRRVAGARVEVHTVPTPGIALSTGIDIQVMSDDRINRRHDAGTPWGDPYLDQVERVGEFGAFVQAIRHLGTGWLVRLGARHDRIDYTVTDRVDAAAGGTRQMSAWSAAGSLAWSVGQGSAWIGAGTAFETPTSTELGNTADGSTGLNRGLMPARVASLELGLRLGTELASAELVGFASRTRDAITAVAELGGRSYYDNIGTTVTAGIELAARWQPRDWLTLRGAATALRARFGDDAVAAAGASVAHHKLPGVTPVAVRLGATAVWRGASLDIDHGWTDAVWADDRNTVEVPGWGVGVTNAMLRLRPRGMAVEAQLGVRNLADRPHAIGVIVNGGFGRVVEPGAGRRVVVGLAWSSK